MKKLLGIMAMLPIALFLVPTAQGQDYYKGKTITVIVGSGPGSFVDLIAAPFNPVWQKYIPGNPNVIIKHLPGAGGQKAYNTVFNRTRPDGETLVMAPWRPLAHLLGSKDIQYKPADGNLLGGGGIYPVAVIRTDAAPGGIKSGADVAKAKGVIAIAGPRPEGMTSMLSRLSLKILGVKFRFVSGYRGQNKMATALRQNEVQFLSTEIATYKQLFEDNIIKPKTGIAAWTHTEFDGSGNAKGQSKLFPGVKPFHVVYREVHGKDPSGPAWDAYKWVSLMTYSSLVGVWAPPKTPAAAVKALRIAHAKAVQDPAHVAEKLRALKLDMNWASPKDLPLILKSYQGIDPKVAAFLKEMVAASSRGDVQ